MDLYETLGVPKDASPEQIKHTFREKAKSTHPDAGGDKAQFTAIATAYEILGDPQKRAHYDETGDAPGTEANERTEALAIIDIIFGEVMNQLQDYQGLVCNELVVDMRKVIVDKMGQLDREIGQTRDRIGRLHTFGARFTASDGENTLAKMIEFRCTGYEKRLIGLQKGKRLHEVALDIIKDQAFTADPNPQAQYYPAQSQQQAQPLPPQGAARGGLGAMFFGR